MKSRIAQIEEELKAIGYSHDQISQMINVENKYELNELSLPTIKSLKQKLWKTYLAKIHAAELLKTEIDNLQSYINIYKDFID